jgi:hypothetical protein
MKSYTVHAPSEGEPEPEQFAFVKEGFSWPALFFPVIWMLWHKLWLALVWYVVFVLCLAWVDRLAGEMNATILALLGALILAFEANNLRRFTLESRGWREIGASTGRDLIDAEIRFFDRWTSALASRTEREALARAAASPPLPLQETDEAKIFGLFPEPGR